MQTAVLSASPVRGHRFYYRLLFAAAFPFLLASEFVNRMSRTHADGRPEMRMRSAFAEARANTLVAISYAVMARSALRTSARQSGTERLS